MTPKKRLLVVFGTRPEAIKMAPVVRALNGLAGFELKVCVTGQHRHMLDQVLALFEIVPDFDLDIMTANQSLADTTAKILTGVTHVLEQWRPDLVFVHGDTNTAASASLACFYQKIAVAHVEAGLRTGDMDSPWPEEFNRRLVSMVAKLHFAPTVEARANLLAEGIPDGAIHVTGNTVIDALLQVRGQIHGNARLQQELETQFDFIDGSKRVLLVTGHRRENFGDGIVSICAALETLAKRGDITVVYPVHKNPNIKGPVESLLGNCENVYLLDALDYVSFVYLMMKSTLILTDSGGIQEEAPSLGKPVLVMRDTTERPEAVAAGTVRIVGSQRETIVSEVIRLLEDPDAYDAMTHRANPYGNGVASDAIAAAVLMLITAPA